MSDCFLARTALAGGIVFAVLSFAVHKSGSVDVWFRQASRQLGEGSDIAQPLTADGERPAEPPARAFDRAHQTLRPDGTRQSPVAWP
ncbi:hypothetical protein J2848_005304 [Azospirillum lipoferum]|uniref:Uncharacterized protein n=1 Tax=Azospirillum lipoferum TaxID=193 RepID=A0A5A9GIZ5_AZOLI|nr:MULTISPECIES: hypothetical protein [Azospirillum]KAA0593199.1 hypothetical protein FZ942_25015 [Azospirillum lipoferum]MCP1613608.1 hypothetical protein [Azospirillum lipoferum]MDW5532370.1 hypothetical protein [Azospirillum sp. NL1]